MIFIHKETGEIFELGLYVPYIRDINSKTLLVVDKTGIQCLESNKNLEFIGWL